MSRLRSVPATARLLILMASLFGEESGRDITRYRFGSASLRKVSMRSRIRSAFLADLEEELAQLGWILVTIHSDLYGIIRAEKIESWTQVSPKRLSARYSDLPNGIFGNAFRKYLEAPSHPHYTIKEIDDQTILDIFDSVAEVPEDTDSDD